MSLEEQLTTLPQRQLLEIITGQLLIVQPTYQQATSEGKLLNWSNLNLYLINDSKSDILQGWQLNHVENFQLIGNFMSDCKSQGMLYFWGNDQDDIIQISGLDSCPQILLVSTPETNFNNLAHAVILLNQLQSRLSQLEQEIQ
jgi:hypothetical protein